MSYRCEHSYVMAMHNLNTRRVSGAAAVETVQRRKTTIMGIDTLIANILVINIRISSTA